MRMDPGILYNHAMQNFSLCVGIVYNHAMQIPLCIDLVLPHFLLCPRRVMTDPQEGSHLLHADKQDLSRHVEPDTLGTRGRRQASPGRLSADVSRPR